MHLDDQQETARGRARILPVLALLAALALIPMAAAAEPDSEIVSPISLAPREALHLSGFAYPDSLDRLAGTPYMVNEPIGSGHLVLFLDDPNFRNYWRGLSRLFLNSILLSPSF